MMDRMGTSRPYTPPSGVLDIFKREFDGAYENGGLYLLTMHPHISGHSSRIQILEELIAHIRQKPGLWFARHDEVAAYCKAEAGM